MSTAIVDIACRPLATALQVNRCCGHAYDSLPATPQKATVWYDSQLLVATSATQHSGPTAIQAHCAALQQLHMSNGCGLGAQTIWRNLAIASRDWLRLEVNVL